MAIALRPDADTFIALPGTLTVALGAAYWLNKRRLKDAGRKIASHGGRI